MFMHFQKPILIVAGKMQYLFDETGRRFVDVRSQADLELHIG